MSPVYCYETPDGDVIEEFFPIASKAPQELVLSDGTVATRSIAAEHGANTSGVGRFAWPKFSKAAGMHPNQITPEYMKRFPHHEFNMENGEMRFNSFQHQNRCLRDIGMVDFDGNQSGRH